MGLACSMKESVNSEDLGVDDRILFKMYIKEVISEDVHWIHLCQGQGPLACFCEHGKNLSDFRKDQACLSDHVSASLFWFLHIRKQN